MIKKTYSEMDKIIECATDKINEMLEGDTRKSRSRTLTQENLVPDEKKYSGDIRKSIEGIKISNKEVYEKYTDEKENIFNNKELDLSKTKSFYINNFPFSNKKLDYKHKRQLKNFLNENLIFTKKLNLIEEFEIQKLINFLKTQKVEKVFCSQKKLSVFKHKLLTNHNAYYILLEECISTFLNNKDSKSFYSIENYSNVMFKEFLKYFYDAIKYSTEEKCEVNDFTTQDEISDQKFKKKANFYDILDTEDNNLLSEIDKNTESSQKINLQEKINDCKNKDFICNEKTELMLMKEKTDEKRVIIFINKKKPIFDNIKKIETMFSQYFIRINIFNFLDDVCTFIINLKGKELLNFLKEDINLKSVKNYAKQKNDDSKLFVNNIKNNETEKINQTKATNEKTVKPIQKPLKRHHEKFEESLLNPYKNCKLDFSKKYKRCYLPKLETIIEEDLGDLDVKSNIEIYKELQASEIKNNFEILKKKSTKELKIKDIVENESSDEIFDVQEIIKNNRKNEINIENNGIKTSEIKENESNLTKNDDIFKKFSINDLIKKTLERFKGASSENLITNDFDIKNADKTKFDFLSKIDQNSTHYPMNIPDSENLNENILPNVKNSSHEKNSEFMTSPMIYYDFNKELQNKNRKIYIARKKNLSAKDILKLKSDLNQFIENNQQHNKTKISKIASKETQIIIKQDDIVSKNNLCEMKYDKSNLSKNSIDHSIEIKCFEIESSEYKSVQNCIANLDTRLEHFKQKKELQKIFNYEKESVLSTVFKVLEDEIDYDYKNIKFFKGIHFYQVNYYDISKYLNIKNEKEEEIFFDNMSLKNIMSNIKSSIILKNTFLERTANNHEYLYYHIDTKKNENFYNYIDKKENGYFPYIVRKDKFMTNTRFLIAFKFFENFMCTRNHLIYLRETRIKGSSSIFVGTHQIFLNV
ncbi:hypothetical protein GVAV_001107 [Gurleya vavrai]